MPVVAHGFHETRERSLFSLAVSSADQVPSQLELNSRHFVCLLAWDARQSSVESVSALAARLIRAGASYFVCWGPDCERVHYVIDQLVSEPGNTFGVPDGSCIMTTSHESGALEAALWFFLMVTWPDDHFFDSTRAGLAVSVGSPEWALAISSALEDVQAFVQRSADVVA